MAEAAGLGTLKYRQRSAERQRTVTLPLLFDALGQRIDHDLLPVAWGCSSNRDLVLRGSTVELIDLGRKAERSSNCAFVIEQRSGQNKSSNDIDYNSVDITESRSSPRDHFPAICSANRRHFFSATDMHTPDQRL